MKRFLCALILLTLYLCFAGCRAREREAVRPASVAQVTTRALGERESSNLFYTSASADLNHLQDYFHASLKANEKIFQGSGRRVTGFGAGASYPQIWLRDSATIIPVSRYYYPSEYLTSWLEEHLSHQSLDGGLYDWIAPGEAANFRAAAPQVREVYQSAQSEGGVTLISADKNSSEADQETSAVDAAYRIFQITGGRDWLNKSINGRTLISRLDGSLEYLLKQRFNTTYGLVTSALTADWGDVTPAYADQRAIYLDSRTPQVVSLYTNALFYRAATQMAEMQESVANRERAGYWRARAQVIRENINQHLWQEERGFYRMHLLVTPELVQGVPDVSDIFALGGNAVAVLSGVADDRQAKRVFDVSEERQKRFNISTIAGSLLPPFPAGFFKHPAVSGEYVYQNGGQWDWFAGRFLLAEFERGATRRAYRQLLEVARKNVRNNGLYEWDSRTGEGRGSVNYAGSAGTLGEAVVRGLFGVYLKGRALDLRIRLGERMGRIRLRQPATDSYVAYSYSYDAAGGSVKLDYESNLNSSGRLCLLLPEGLRPLSLSLDGAGRDFTVETTGEDSYACTATDWKPHRVELRVAR